MSRPTILVTNDDGYQSRGISTLASALAELGDVTVVAPDVDRSGVGHSVSIASPVRVSRVEGRDVPTYRASGTPADCVAIGAFDLCGTMPSLLVSGINRGANLGDDVTYSGTVAAALEGTLIGIPSIALSLAASWPEHAREHAWQSAIDVVLPLAGDVLRDGLAPLTLLNVNVPNLPTAELRGTRWTRQGRKPYADRLDKRADPRGGVYYWLWGTFDPEEIVDDTDLGAVRDGYVSITPLTIDRTDYAELDRRGAPAH